MVDTDDTRRTTDDGRRTTPREWHKLPTGELKSEKHMAAKHNTTQRKIPSLVFSSPVNLRQQVLIEYVFPGVTHTGAGLDL